MTWTTPSYSKKQVDRAGAILVSQLDASPQQVASALEVIGNWRAGHAFPLNTFQMGLRKRAQRVMPTALVAQRLKRLPTMVDKLRRMPKTPLSRFQDIGGCRAVVKTISQLQTLKAMYRRSKMKHELVRERDYISAPRASGYRCVHLVYKYVGRDGDGFDGLQIEIQLRTQVQHAWATAVETVGTLLDQSLKSSEGSAEWLRFFAIVGSAFAFVERTPAVPGTPNIPTELWREIDKLQKRLDVRRTLDTYRFALKAIEQHRSRDASFFLLSLDTVGQQLEVFSFRGDELEAATVAYAAEEQKVAGKAGAQVVLVGAHSLTSLRKAYPNYFLDTELFIRQLEVAKSRLQRARGWPDVTSFLGADESRARQGQLF